MKRFSAAAFLLATIVPPAFAGAATPKRLVDLEITLPNGSVARATTVESEGVVVKLVNNTRYGFVPTLPDRDDVHVVITIWDVEAKPMQKLGTISVEVGAAAVRTDTAPSFAIRAVRVVKLR
jgi:hypothetical protein